MVKASGDSVWHHHKVDDILRVSAGELTIQLPDDPAVPLRADQLDVTRRGVDHRPYCATACQLMLFEPPGVTNTGQSGGQLTAVDTWI